jgi:hypothetical protein
MQDSLAIETVHLAQHLLEPPTANWRRETMALCVKWFP